MNAQRTLVAIAASGTMLGSSGLALASGPSIDTGVRVGSRSGYVEVSPGRHGGREHVDIQIGTRTYSDHQPRRRGRSDARRQGRRGYGHPTPHAQGGHGTRGPVYDSPPPPRRRDNHNDDHANLSYEIARAWSLAARGKPVRARRLFGDLLAHRPNDANLKAGFAVVAVMEGDYQRAAWSMRRAFRQDLSRLHSIPDTPGVRARLNKVTRRVRNEIAHYGETPDLLFLLASLEILRGDDYAAMEAADRARYLGEEGPALRRMRHYLRRH